MKTKVLFLDIDGVINLDDGFSKTAMRELNRIVSLTGCDVVVISEWRKTFGIPELEKILEEKGFRGKIAGYTPDFMRMEEDPDLIDFEDLRAREIMAWLADRTEVVSWIAADDMNLPLLKKNFVHCPDGLTREKADQAVKLLVRKSRPYDAP